MLGEAFDAVIPENGLAPIMIAIIDATTGLFTAEQLANLIWSLRYQALFQHNRSPWVEKGYSAPVADVVGATLTTLPAGAWPIELVDQASEPGALGWHEDRSKQSSAHSVRGVKLHHGEEVPAAVVGVQTSLSDGVRPSEVASHELLEMAVDPWVMSDVDLRVYTNPADGQEYIGEVGDPCQGRGYDVRAPEGRATPPCPEAIVADFAYPGWWAQPQTREATSAAEEFALSPRLEPFELAPGGYMSVRPPGGEWSQIYGSNRPKAEANAHAYERPGEVG